MKRESVKALLKYLSASFPNQLEFPKGDKDRDKMIIDTWHDWLKNIGENNAKVAVKQAAFENPKWVPSPASILKAVQELENDYPGPNEAWKLAKDKFENKRTRAQASKYVNGEMPDKVKVPEIVEKATDRFEQPLTGQEKDMPFIRNQFINTYKEVLEDGQRKSGLKNYLSDGEEVKKLEGKDAG